LPAQLPVLLTVICSPYKAVMKQELGRDKEDKH